MNLSTEDNNLPLFKYAPEITSQLLIQTNEAQEYIQIPNIGDDLLLTGLEDGTYAWTLNSLPVLLNNQNDSQSLLVNQEESLQELNSQKEILSDFLGTETVENQFDTQTNETEIIFPLELPEKKFLTDNGLYITNNHEDISSNLVNNVTLNSENIQPEESSNDNIQNEIQSSDVSSQEAFVDINGLLISQESILNLNTPDFPFNIQESNDINVTLSNNKLKHKKQKTTAKRSLKINSLNNNNSQRLNGEDVETVQNQIESDNNENLFNIDDFKIINLDGTSTFLNIDASTDQINSNIDIENNRKIDDLAEIGLQIDNEPDSTTILNDFDETLNINELATIVQTFQCKKCDFSCNDREQFLTHFKEVHYVLTKKKSQVFPLKKVNDSLPKNLKIKKVSLFKDHKVKRFKKSEDTNIQLIINEGGNLINEIPEPVFENSEIPVLNENENTSVLKEESVEIINDSHLNEQESNSLINFTESVSTTDSSQLSVENNINVESSVDSYQPIKIIYDDKEYTSFAVLIQHEEVEKKIMRVKRKKKQSKKKTLIELTQDFDKNTSGVTYSFTDVKKLHINKNSNISPSAVTVATDVSNIKELIQSQPIIQENIDESNLSPIFLCASDISSTVISSDVPAVEPEDELQLQTVDEQQNLSPIYVCATCNEQFLTVEECKLHYIEVHKCEDKSNEFNSGDDNTKTIESNLKLIADSELPNHKQILEKFFNQDLKKRKHKCSVKGCPYRFAKIDLLKRHEACHVNGTRSPFCCPECKEQFNSWRMCSIHLWKCHKVDIDFYTCPLCDYKGSTCDKLKHHIKIHSEDREYICPDCGRDFKQPSQLRNHRVIHLDKNDLKSVPRWFIQKHCEMCGKLFADTKCLKKHIQAVHSKLKPFICNVCGHSCARKAMLQLHLRQHTGDKPYSCSICKYKTGDHNSLRRHIMRHTGDRPYKCPYCDYAAIQSNSYKNHLSTKHPGKNGFFKCNECSFKTVNEEIFHSHKNDHNLGLIQSDKSKTADISTIINIHNDNTSSSEILNNNLSTNNGRIVEQLTDCNKKNFDIEDDETQNCLFSSLSDLTDEQTVDTGGITIPADPDPSVV